MHSGSLSMLTDRAPINGEFFVLLWCDGKCAGKVEKWSRDGQRIEELLFAGNSLDKARRIFEPFIQRRPRARLTTRQRTRVLREWPPT